MTCAFTGLRELPLRMIDGDPAYDSLRLRLQKEITLLCEQGAADFYCGMALGADQLCAEILLDVKREFQEVRLHAAVPFRDQASRWSPTQQARYADILGRCDTVTVLCEEYQKDCCLARNRWMVKRAELLLAVCDPARVPWRSGTGAAVRYAQARGKGVVLVPPLV